MARITYLNTDFRSFPADVPANLVGKEGYGVELLPTTGTIQLYTATAGRPLLGFLYERLEGDPNWNVRLMGGGGTVKAVAGGAITAPGFVKVQNGGTVVAATSGNLAHGYLIYPFAAACAANDIVEINDAFITVP